MQAEPSWAVLRHLVLATETLSRKARGLPPSCGCPPGFGDPELAAIGLTDRNMPVGGQKYLEVVGPLGPGSYINRWLDRCRRPGRLLPVGPGARRARVPAACGRARRPSRRRPGGAWPPDHSAASGRRRRPARARRHPRPDRWFWDDITPGPRPDALIDDITRGHGRRARPRGGRRPVGAHYRPRAGHPDPARLLRLRGRVHRAPARAAARGDVPLSQDAGRHGAARDPAQPAAAYRPPTPPIRTPRNPPRRIAP